MKSKIHNCVVTAAELNYVGSVTIDQNLMDACGLLPGEKVLIVNNKNGERIETYTIKGKRGSGVICLNGAAAHKFKPEDTAIIMAFGMMHEDDAESYKPKVIFPNNRNTQWQSAYQVARDLVLVHKHKGGTIDSDYIEGLSLQMALTTSEIIEIIQNLNLH